MLGNAFGSCSSPFYDSQLKAIVGKRCIFWLVAHLAPNSGVG
jgi:hypothetical protein